MQAYLLGIDIGTGSTKAVAVSFSGEPIDVSQHYYPVKSPKPGYSEQDPALIFEAFISCITDTVKKIGYPPYAVSLSSAMHSVIPVDADGKALADMITWADARSEDIAQKLRATAQGEFIYKTSGTPIHAMTPLCKLMWLRENQNALFIAAHKFISIKEYIWYQLFNEFQVDCSIASATGLFDIINLKWNPTACDLVGITEDKLSEPVNTIYKRADLNKGLALSLKLNTDTPFIIGASDGCCANLGSFVTEPGTASLTIGTSGAVRITSKQPVYNYPAMVFNYLLKKETFVCGGAVNNGGIALNWLIKTFLNKQLPGHSDYDTVFNQIATIEAGSDGLIFLPYLYGERAPLWDTQSCGVFFNIKPQHTQAHFLRAGLEGICFALYDVLQTVEQSAAPIDQLNISGGFITSTVWTQMLANITGKKLVIVQQEDASAMGAIFLAIDALNLDLHISQKPPVTEMSLIPHQPTHQAYNQGFSAFKTLYQNLKETMHLLHNM
ncbi:gluconate kinase, FGGY family [Mucilaginibacter mallensis]|uniref:Gluconate kinase, FGGY family n=1 Tax=Mucilaginibacter mallensis TaxID=652787 RepID=A0A1H1VL31_MUCMA|nr:gluconokinase [Mucilaginibacter mallensis]SDS85240.1 gluconate kinase, FGGY family [Mucilaginibacter mallensis]